MRPLEWFVLLSFVPVLLLPFVARSRRRRWLLVAALPILTSVGQVFGEGWRTQMVPLYVLAALVLASRLPAQVGRHGAGSRGRRVLASVVTGAVVAVCGVLPGWLLPVVALPEPTGPYRVGIVDRELVDAARGRRLMTSVWYPAAEGGPAAPLTPNPDQVVTALSDLTSLPSPLFQHLRYVRLAANEGVPAHVAAEPFPVLVFSHGLVGMRLQSSSTLQELASWGYVVVAVDHTDAAAVTVFPDGEARYYDPERFGIPSDVVPSKTLVNDRMFPVWVADQRYVYDTLEIWESNDPLLGGKLDLGRIGSFGHSIGGATALEVCLVDTRCRGAANLDGGLYGETETRPANQPLILMSSADSGSNQEAVASWESLIRRATGPAYWLELPNSSHLSFTFTQLLSPLLPPAGFDPRAGLLVVDTYLRAFFDTHLRGTDAPPLGAASGDTDVRWLTE